MIQTQVTASHSVCLQCEKFQKLLSYELPQTASKVIAKIS